MNSLLKIGLLGCGFISDYYVENIKKSSKQIIISCFDTNKKRLSEFSKYHNIKAAKSFIKLLKDPDINIILNLTPSKNHYKIIKKCLEYGKSVYTEKPITLEISQTIELFNLSKEKKLILWSSPSLIFNQSSKIFRKKILPKIDTNNVTGYGYFESPPLANLKVEKWINPSGAKWPLESELKNGPILEHSGYLIAFFCSFLGPVKKISSIPSKIFSENEIKKLNSLRRSLGNNHCITKLYFEKDTVINLIISEKTKSKRSIEIYDENISLLISDIRDDFSSIIFNDKRLGNFISSRANRIDLIARRISNFIPTPFVIPFLTTNPFTYTKRVKFNNLRILDILKNQKPANFALGLEAIMEYKLLKDKEPFMEKFFLHCNEVTLLMDKFSKESKINSKFNLEKIQKFFAIIDK